MKIFLIFCVSIIVVAYVESPIWCCFDETMTGSLMVPIVYINDDLGEDAITDPYGIPLLGVFILLLSSFCVSNFETHIEGFEKKVVEYNKCPACVVYSSWYGACLILIIFHGFHVFVGLLFLSAVLFRIYF
ncbi:unnamed protein product [Protopolystoma xenopodis]|uniref:Cytochrome c oxidase subunit 3 n=1 Tax=Protopolystoma xenopodis TaxID=117903 RepID=A0A448WVM3_9PLAT|nr:unnamed protein product [Protopolystoma xenopodis]